MSSLEGQKVKSGTTWRVVYYWKGSKEQVKIGITSKRIAQQRKVQIDNLIAMDKNLKFSLQHNSGVHLTDLRDLDAEWCSSRKRPRTIKINLWCLNRLINWSGDSRIYEVNRNSMERYLIYLRDELRCNDTTVNMQLRTLKAIFQRAVDEHSYISEHPFRSLKPYSSQRQSDKMKFLTEEQIKTLLDSINNIHFKILVQFYLMTGCRRSEAIELKWSDIDEQSGIFYLGQADSQTKLRRSFPLTDDLKHLFNELSNENNEEKLVFWHFSKHPPEISRTFQKLRNNVEDLPNELTTHILRHTFASHLVMQGIDISTIASLLYVFRTFGTNQPII